MDGLVCAGDARCGRAAAGGANAQVGAAAHLLICLWLFFVSLPPSQDLAGRLATGFNRLGVGVLVGPQFKINDGNTMVQSLRPAYTVVYSRRRGARPHNRERPAEEWTWMSMITCHNSQTRLSLVITMRGNSAVKTPHQTLSSHPGRSQPSPLHALQA